MDTGHLYPNLLLFFLKHSRIIVIDDSNDELAQSRFIIKSRRLALDWCLAVKIKLHLTIPENYEAAYIIWVCPEHHDAREQLLRTLRYTGHPCASVQDILFPRRSLNADRHYSARPQVQSEKNKKYVDAANKTPDR